VGGKNLEAEFDSVIEAIESAARLTLTNDWLNIQVKGNEPVIRAPEIMISQALHHARA
jgi:hypothetical protein